MPVVRTYIRILLSGLAATVLSTLVGCAGLVSNAPGVQPGSDQVTINTAGGGTGTITSSPSGISCTAAGSGTSSGTCQATFNNTASVTLTATPDSGITFGGWSGCSSTSGNSCTLTS